MPLEGQAKLDYMRKRYAENRERLLNISRKWHEDNREYHNKKQREYYHSDPERKERIKERQRLYNETHREAISTQRAERYRKPRVRRQVRNANLLRLYGISIEDYERMVVEQNGMCAICGTTEPKGRGGFHLDHDHVTGKNRQLLCTPCNTTLGLIKESVETLSAMIQYLERHNAPIQLVH
jgi:hypothetical protein